jgi:4-amino-4-deoxy-L-arabinose transferase-like glycosyltransferase
MTAGGTVYKYRAEILLLAILFLSAFLNIWNIWSGGISNAYYAAAVKSALVNPVAGFFNSLDPAGFITVDKPPVGIWVQALFAAVLGFSGWTIILPQALAGVGSVALIYCIVSRPFGKPAGLVAAFALAVTPISVAIARNGTMDMQMIFVILLAVWAALKAAREGSFSWLLVSAILVGIGFNIKMIQAFIVVPAILAVYLVGAAGIGWQKRILHLGLAVVVLLAVSLSWALAVDSIPADQRPFIGGSGDNTVMSLILNYNGAHRLGIGESGGGPGNGAPGASAGGMPGQGTGNRTMAAPGGGSGISSAGPGSLQGFPANDSGAPPGSSGGMAFSGQDQQVPASGMQQPGSSGPSGGGPGGMGGGGGGFGGGSPGLFRLFQSDLAGDIAWLLPFALIGVLAWVRRPRALSLEGIEEAGYSGEKGLTLLAMLLWLVPGLLYFSFTSGFWHDYYIATIAPPLAALVGIGAAGMWREYCSGSRSGVLLVIAVLVTGLLQAWFLSGITGSAGSLALSLLAATIAVAALLSLMMVQRIEVLENRRWHIAAVAIAILLIAPLAWSCMQLPGGNSGNLPSAALSGGSRGGMGGTMGGSMGGGGDGPGGSSAGSPGSSGMSGPGSMAFPGMGSGSSPSDTAGQSRPGMTGNRTAGTDAGGFPGNRTSGFAAMNGGPGGMGSSGSTSQLAQYLLSRTTSETWILAVPGSHEGSDLIIQTGKPVMCIGGFTGSDSFLTVSALETYIREGKVRFFQTSGTGGGSGGGNSAIFSWVSSHCTAVDISGSSGSSGGQSSTLYDCKGYSGQAGT